MEKIKITNIIYPAIILAIAALTAFCTIKSIEFITGSVNAIFTTDDSATQTLKVNISDYLLVAKKLGLTAPNE